MFSISTMASSTMMPVESVMASRLTMLREKPSMSIAQKAGMIDSGRVTAAMMVARRSRRNRNTTITASAAPSNKVLQGLMVAGDRGIDRGVDQLELDVRVFRLEAIDPVGHRRRHGHVARPFGAQDAESHHRLAVGAREAPRLGNGVGNGAEIVEPDLTAARKRDPHRRQSGERGCARERANGLVAAADLCAPAGEIHVGAAQAAADVERGEADGLEAVGVEPDTDLAIDAADALDPPDIADALQRAA